MGWTFTNEAGTVLDFDDGTDYDVLRWSGIGMPGLDTLSLPRHGRPGSVLRRASMPSRMVNLLMWCHGTSEADHDANAEALIAHVAGSYGRPEPRFGVLKFTRVDATVRSLRCIGSDGLSRPEGQRITPTLSRFIVQFFADHPNWYDPTQQSSDLTIGSGATAVYPLTYPQTYGLDGQAALATITNAGSAETRSIEWSAPGPCTAPALFNSTTEQQISFANLIVPSGLTLKVRSGWQPDGIRDIRAFLDDGFGAETSVIGDMDTASRFPRLDPGANEIEVSQTNEAATVHTIKHHREYLAA